jgi:hypothetical protein
MDLVSSGKRFLAVVVSLKREKKHRLIVFGGGWQKAFHGSPLLQL